MMDAGASSAPAGTSPARETTQVGRGVRDAALLAAFAFAAAAIHAAIVAGYANPIAFSDEWIAIIDDVLRPLAGGHLGLWDLFRPHNEHTMVWTRLLAVFAIWFDNGQYDNVPVALFNCLLYAGAFCVPIFLFFRHSAPPQRLFAVVLGLIALVPIEGEDLIFGFQNQYYFLIAGSTAVLWFAASADTLRLRARVLFALAGFATCVSMGSGFFAALLAMPLCALRMLQEPEQRRGLRLFLLIAATVTLYGIVLAVNAFLVMKAAGILGSKQFGLEGIRRIFSCLAWPYAQSAWIGVLVSLPFGFFALVLLRRWRTRMLRADLLALGLGLWVGMQICALALDRNSEAGTLASRYLPVMLFWPALNLYALMRLVERMPWFGSRAGALVLAAIPVAASGALIANVAKLAQGSLAAMSVASSQHAMQAANIARYVREHDRNALYGAGHMGLPYSNTMKLQMLLDDPAVRNGLPINVRPGLALKPDVPATFIPFGAYEAVPHLDGLQGFGSYADGGDRFLGDWRSAPLATDFPYLFIDLAGYLPLEGLALKLECVDSAACRPVEVHPPGFAHESWQGMYAPVPARRFRIVAQDHSPERWFAFSAPIEAGRLSVVADAVVARLRAEPSLWVSLACGILGMLLLFGISDGTPPLLRSRD